MNLTDLLSPQLGPMSDRVQSLVSAYKEVWESTPADPPRLLRRYSRSKKKELEKEFSLFVDQYVITRSCAFLYMEAAGRYKGLFSRKCVRRLGRSFPVRFSYLQNLRDTQAGFIPAQKKIRGLDSASLSILTLTSRLLT
jgi:hypothetical protein